MTEQSEQDAIKQAAQDEARELYALFSPGRFADEFRRNEAEAERIRQEVREQQERIRAAFRGPAKRFRL